MKTYLVLLSPVILLSFLFSATSCKKAHKNDPVNPVDTTHGAPTQFALNYTIVKGRAIRTLLELQSSYPLTDLSAPQYEWGFVYSSSANSTLRTGTKVLSSSIIIVNTGYLLPGLIPNSTYYIKGYVIRLTPTRDTIYSTNEVSMTTANDNYSNLQLTASSSDYKLGMPRLFTPDFISHVGSSLNNYLDLINASINIYFDDTVLYKRPTIIYVSSAFPDDIEVTGLSVILPCGLQAGNHNVKANIDGVYTSNVMVNMLASDTVHASSMSLSKQQAAFYDYIYIENLSTAQAQKCLGVKIEDNIVESLSYDAVLSKYYFVIGPALNNHEIKAGSKNIRLVVGCNEYSLGTVTVN